MIATNEPQQPTGVERKRSRRAWLAILLLSSLHVLASWSAVGGWKDLTSSVPQLLHDHPLHQHSMATARFFLSRNGLPAGYDPSVMAGYPKSIIFPQSDTLLDLAGFLVPGVPIVITYKWLIFLSLASLPWWIMGTGAMLRIGAGAIASAVALFLLYVWTDGGGGGFPLNFALFGMLTYLVGIPVALAATAAVVRFLDQGGVGRLIAAYALSSVAFLTHPTAPLTLGPAALFAYVAACFGPSGRGRARSVGFWLLPVVVVMVNAFWWLPGFWLRATKGDSGFVFAHPEPVLGRLTAIFTAEPPIQAVLIALGVVGLVVLAHRDRIAAAALAGFAVAGLGWGYLAGSFRSLDFLQPGRQTYALYAAASLLGGVALAEISRRMKGGGRSFAYGSVVGLALVGVRVFGPQLYNSVQLRLGLYPSPQARPFLATRPDRQFDALLAWIRSNVEPGERLYYEEAGFGDPTDPEPFQGARYSGLLPELAKVEIIGGPYLHAAVLQNFTQIGEGKLFGGPWTRERFLRYAALYRPSAIVCWSRAARAFCKENPDLIQISYQDGRLLAGRIVGFGGTTIQGEAEVQAEPGLLRIRNMKPGPDGLIVLRYHHAPGLRSRPPVPLEPVRLEDDPVPFIGLRPTLGQSETTIDLAFPPG